MKWSFNPIPGTLGALLSATIYAGGAGVVHAQSMTLYGVIDTGVEYVNNIGADNRSVVRVPSITGSTPSRWGMRGVEDLGGGMKAIFTLESGFAMSSGSLNQGGRLFGRQAWVGVNSPQWGQLTFGRQMTMLLWATMDTDVLGPNIYGNGSLDNYIPNARADNAVAYKFESGGWTVGATYSFGRDTVNAGPSPAGMNCPGQIPGNSRACREWSALLMYKTSQYGANIAYDSLRGGAGAFGGLNSPAQTDDRMLVGAFVAIPNGRIAASWLRRTNDANPKPVSDLFSLGVSYDASPAINLAAQVAWLGYHGSPNQAWLYAVRGMYSLSKRTSVYVTSGLIDNRAGLALAVSADAVGSAPAAGKSQFGTMIGMRHAF
ncbi:MULTISPECIES: porin [Pandoraea]|uniref:porin n=1 Tax=Pandoraea TaxID=93217 RepID=UPI001F5DB28C|nr:MULTISPECIES: porin [Pandoraea]MCI3204985.1 porin [Pandoraea sp. LA3]MDN4583013.1 porin [Pandoraea capi]